MESYKTKMYSASQFNGVVPHFWVHHDDLIPPLFIGTAHTADAAGRLMEAHATAKALAILDGLPFRPTIEEGEEGHYVTVPVAITQQHLVSFRYYDGGDTQDAALTSWIMKPRKGGTSRVLTTYPTRRGGDYMTGWERVEKLLGRK